jgi:hypothetical protein
MSELFASGRIIDLILVLVALEAAALLLWRARSGRGPAPVPLLCNLASGAALMLALRAALTGAAWPVIAGCLVGSLLAHATELGLRLGAGAEAGGSRGHEDVSAKPVDRIHVAGSSPR